MTNKWIEGIGNVQLCVGTDVKTVPLLNFVFNRLLVIHAGVVLTPMREWRVMENPDGRKNLELEKPATGEIVIYYI